MKYLDENGLLYLVQKIKTWLTDKANASDLTSHTGNTTVHITSDERTKWNASKTHADSAHAPSDAEANVQSDWNVTDTASDAYIKNKPTIPTNNNQLTNGAGYQTASQVSTAIANAVKDIASFEFEVVTSLPTTGVKGKIYLVAHAHGTGDAYDEYIWTGSAFEKIGNTDVDLSGYQKKCVVFNDGDTIVNLDGLITNYNTGEVRYYYNYGGRLLPLCFIHRLSNGGAQINFEAMVNGTSYKALCSYMVGNCSWSTSTQDYVPATRTINGKALTANISLTAEDVGCTAISNAEIDTICAS